MARLSRVRLLLLLGLVAFVSFHFGKQSELSPALTVAARIRSSTAVEPPPGEGGDAGASPPSPGSDPRLPNATRANARAMWHAIRGGCSRHFNATELSLRPALNASISVVIGAFQRAATLDVVVAALRRQRHVAAVEVLVADAGSSPPLHAQLPELAADQLRYWRDDKLYHRVRNFNTGVAAAAHDVVVLLDDDVVPASDFWAYTALATLDAHPEFAMLRLPVEILEMRADLSDAEARRGELEGLTWSEPHGFPTWNLAVRRSAWEALGGFDKRYDGVYGEEDTDFYARAAGKGLNVGRAEKSACAVHVGVFFGNRGLNKPVRSRGDPV